MKKILILADGEVAERFVARIVDTYTAVNLYDIVYYRGNIAESEAIHCVFYKFDPTSFSKLETIYSRDCGIVFILMREDSDSIQAYKNIRILSKEVKVCALDYGAFDNFGKDDENLLRISASELLANKMMAFVPNIPVSANNIGLGKGEIIEVEVPFGSSYAYRHINHIDQKKWSIAAIYRGGNLVLPKSSLMLRPNDNLILIGEPKILKTVYRAIKIESGQFPMPYGRTLYAILDISSGRDETAASDLEAILHIHKRLKSQPLYIKVINPNSWAMLEKLQSAKYQNVYIDIDYRGEDIVKVLREEFQRLNVGVAIIGNDFFKLKRNRKILSKLQKPIWKLGANSILKIKNATLLLSSSPSIEQLSNVFFDLASQFRIGLALYPSQSESENEKNIIEHYENSASIHSRTIEIKTSDENAILRLRKENGHLLFFPFDERNANVKILDFIMSMRAEKMYSLLSAHHQIFIPVS